MGSDSKGQFSSGENISYWIDSVPPLFFETLKQDIETDILIIGGGIAGLTTAYCLASSGKRVIIVEDGAIGSGESGRTTAHLTNALDDRYYKLQKLFGKRKAKLTAESHTAAIDWIEKTIQTEEILCDFLRLEGYLFLHPTDKLKNLEKEFEATQLAGLNTERLNSIPGISGENGGCIRFPRQGQFHIMKYLNKLAEVARQKGVRIFTNTHARYISEKGAIANGCSIKASDIVIATNTPVNDFIAIHTKQFAYRTYVIGGLVKKNSLTFSLWWDTGDQDSKWIIAPYHYVRLQSYNDQFDLLIAGGEDHKTGQADKEGIPEDERYKALEGWVMQRFPSIQQIIYRWSGQVMEPLDSLAFIGKNPGNDHVYIISGDSGNGMTHGTLGGIIISDLINRKKNVWADLYNPVRTPLRVAGNYIRESLKAAIQYSDWITKGDIGSTDELEPGNGAIISSGIKKIASYKDEKGRLYLFDATCPHLGCVVQWNADEKSFDCPCHGSRFTKEGIVINGPATENLEKVELKKTAS